ncbi:MAG: uroporphyrinogen-III synthase [Saprospiraceae bacterium]
MKKVFISRKLNSESIFKIKLENEDFEIWDESLLEFELIPFEKIPEVDWIFFYSQKGVQFFFNHIRNNNISFSKKTQFAGFGEKTAEVIEQFTKCHFVGTGNAKTTSPDFLKIAKGKKILFPRAQKSQRSIQQLIDNQSITIDLIVYKNFPKEHFNIPRIDYLFFTSPLNAKVFFQKYQLEKGQKVFAIGQTTAQALTDLGIKNIISPKKPSEEEFVKVLLKNL